MSISVCFMCIIRVRIPPVFDKIKIKNVQKLFIEMSFTLTYTNKGEQCSILYNYNFKYRLQ